MKERRPDRKDEPVNREVTSSDIENAHAAGDGAMGRNDEKLPDEEGREDREEPPRSGPNVY